MSTDDPPPAKDPTTSAARYALQVIELRQLLARIAILVAPKDEPIELIELADTPDLVQHVIDQRDRLHRAAEQAIEDLEHAKMPAPSVLVAMTSYLRAALKDQP